MQFGLTSFLKYFKGPTLTVLFSLVSLVGLAQDRIISGDLTIIGDIVDDLTISQSSRLIVNGTLIVNGDFVMENFAEFELGPEAVVIVKGNFFGSNKVSLNISSLFVVYGNFTGQNGNRTLDAENGNIYIFGLVDDLWTNFDTCDTYDGNSNNVAIDNNCDYGTEDDFIENLDDMELPPDVIGYLNCFNLGVLEDDEVCGDETASFQINEIPNVTYDWQVKTGAEENWISLPNGNNTRTLTIANGDAYFQSGNRFRVAVKATDNQSCQVAVSNAAALTINPSYLEIGNIIGEIETCSGSILAYSIPELVNAISYEWTVPNDWLVSGGATNSSISLTTGITSGEIKVKVTNECGTSREKTLWVNVKKKGIWTGTSDTNWTNPSNWNCDFIPDATTEVNIPTGLTNYPIISQGNKGAVKDLSIEEGAELRVGGTLEVAAFINNSGALHLPGTLVYNGTIAQSIAANTFVGNKVENLVINNDRKLTLNGGLLITGTLNAVAGDLVTNEYLTLVSDASKTALIDGSGNGKVIGKITIQRYLNPAYGYKYFSTPVTGTTVGDFSPYIDVVSAVGFPHFYRYNEGRKKDTLGGATGWEAYTNAVSPLNILEGYAVNFGENTNPVTISLKGEVNNGAYSMELYNNNGAYTKGFNLVGNPYPSPIDWDATDGWANSNIDNAIYFFTTSDSDPYTGTYSSYVGGIRSDDGKSSSIIPSMQGFFVHVNDNQPVGSLAMDNRVRVVDFGQAFLKSSQKKEPSLLRISAGFENEKVQDPLVVYFHNRASDSFDAELDALKMMNTHPAVPNFYNLSPEKKELSINAVSELRTGDPLRLPLGLKMEKSGTIAFRLQDLKESLFGYHIYFVDLHRKISKKLGVQDSYSVFLEKGIHNSRFELILSKTQINDLAVLTKQLFSARADGGTITIKLYFEAAIEGELSVSTLSGQLLKTLRVKNQKEIQIEGIKSSGVYIISMKSGETVTSKKILINK